MWWNKWTGDQAIRGLKQFWLLNTYLAISGKNWLKTDLNHFWIKIYLWTELEGNPSDWMAFSIFVLALFFSPFHVFSFLLSRFFIIYLVAVCCQEKIKRSHFPKEKMLVFGAGFPCLPLYFCLIVAARGLNLWFLPHQRTIDAKWCIMHKSLVNPLISVLLKTKRTEKG